MESVVVVVVVVVVVYAGTVDGYVNDPDCKINRQSFKKL